jgi:hypothetical protein
LLAKPALIGKEYSAILEDSFDDRIYIRVTLE